MIVLGFPIESTPAYQDGFWAGYRAAMREMLDKLKDMDEPKTSSTVSSLPKDEVGL